MSNADGNQPDPNESNMFDDLEQSDGLEGLALPEIDINDPLADLGDPSLTEGGDPLAGLDGPELDGPEILPDVGLEEGAPMAGALDSISEEEPDSTATKGKKAKKPKKAKAKKPEREPGERIGLAGLAVFGVCVLSIVALASLDVMVFLKWGFLFMLLMNVFWLMATAIPFIMWMGRKTLNFQEVVLGLSLAAIIFAVSLLLVELVDYEGEVTPKGVASAGQ